MSFDDIDISVIESLKNQIYTLFDSINGGPNGNGGGPDLDPLTLFLYSNLIPELDPDSEPESDLYPNSKIMIILILILKIII
jgi:hypothetical protein